MNETGSYSFRFLHRERSGFLDMMGQGKEDVDDAQIIHDLLFSILFPLGYDNHPILDLKLCLQI
jgi:hypothetical protein